MIVDIVNEAVHSGARIHKAADTIGISARTIIRWRWQDGGVDRRKGPKTKPANKLSKQECQLGPGHRIVTILCDGGSKYRSRLFNREWLATKGLQVS